MRLPRLMFSRHVGKVTIASFLSVSLITSVTLAPKDTLSNSGLYSVAHAEEDVFVPTAYSILNDYSIMTVTPNVDEKGHLTGKVTITYRYTNPYSADSYIYLVDPTYHFSGVSFESGTIQIPNFRIGDMQTINITSPSDSSAGILWSAKTKNLSPNSSENRNNADFYGIGPHINRYTQTFTTSNPYNYTTLTLTNATVKSDAKVWFTAEARPLTQNLSRSQYVDALSGAGWKLEGQVWVTGAQVQNNNIAIEKTVNPNITSVNSDEELSKKLDTAKGTSNDGTPMDDTWSTASNSMFQAVAESITKMKNIDNLKKIFLVPSSDGTSLDSDLTKSQSLKSTDDIANFGNLISDLNDYIGGQTDLGKNLAEQTSTEVLQEYFKAKEEAGTIGDLSYKDLIEGFKDPATVQRVADILNGFVSYASSTQDWEAKTKEYSDKATAAAQEAQKATDTATAEAKYAEAKTALTTAAEWNRKAGTALSASYYNPAQQVVYSTYVSMTDRKSEQVIISAAEVLTLSDAQTAKEKYSQAETYLNNLNTWRANDPGTSYEEPYTAATRKVEHAKAYANALEKQETAQASYAESLKAQPAIEEILKVSSKVVHLYQQIKISALIENSKTTLDQIRTLVEDIRFDSYPQSLEENSATLGTLTDKISSNTATIEEYLASSKEKYDQEQTDKEEAIQNAKTAFEEVDKELDKFDGKLDLQQALEDLKTLDQKLEEASLPLYTLIIYDQLEDELKNIYSKYYSLQDKIAERELEETKASMSLEKIKALNTQENTTFQNKVNNYTRAQREYQELLNYTTAANSNKADSYIKEADSSIAELLEKISIEATMNADQSLSLISDAAALIPQLDSLVTADQVIRNAERQITLLESLKTTVNSLGLDVAPFEETLEEARGYLKEAKEERNALEKKLTQPSTTATTSAEATSTEATSQENTAATSVQQTNPSEEPKSTVSQDPSEPDSNSTEESHKEESHKETDSSKEPDSSIGSDPNVVQTSEAKTSEPQSSPTDSVKEEAPNPTAAPEPSTTETTTTQPTSSEQNHKEELLSALDSLSHLDAESKETYSKNIKSSEYPDAFEIFKEAVMEDATENILLSSSELEDFKNKITEATSLEDINKIVLTTVEYTAPTTTYQKVEPNPSNEQPQPTPNTESSGFPSWLKYIFMLLGFGVIFQVLVANFSNR